MAYKRKYRKRSKKLTNKNFANKVKKVLTKQVEKKKFYSQTSTTVSTTATFVPLGNPAQGTTYITRIGDTITPLRVFCKCQITADPTDVWGTIRVIVFQWFDRNATPTLGDILYNLSYPMISPYSYSDRTSFRILGDKTRVVVDKTNAVSKVIYVKCKRPTRKIVFQTGSTSVADNMIYACFVGDSSTIPHPSITMITDFTFMDA